MRREIDAARPAVWQAEERDRRRGVLRPRCCRASRPARSPRRSGL